MSIKILHVLNSPRAEGTPRIVLDWLTVPQYEQDLLFLTAAGELKKDFEQQGNWQFYNTDFIPNIKNVRKIIQLVHKVSKERKPDVVVAWTMGFSHWIHLGARLAGVKKLIAHAGNPPGDDFVGKYIQTWISFGTGRFVNNKVIACSDYVRRQYLTIPFMNAAHIHAVYNCFQVQRFLQTSVVRADRNRAIMVATLERHKDHATLLEAWRILENKGVNCELWLVGNGSLAESLHEQTKTLQLKTVQWLGSRRDVPELLWQSRLFILSTTIHEGFGTVLIEAMAAGCQLVTSDVPACREVLQDGKWGALVTPADPSALAKAIEITFSKQLTAQDVAAQQAYAEQFSPEIMLRKYLKIVGIEN